MDKNRTKMGLCLWCWLAIVTMVSFADEISGQHGSSSQPCNPNPCGPNTSCTVTEKGYPLCWCLKGYSKNSEGLCTPQCKRNQDCASDQYCSGSECREACELRSCPSGAICRASNHVSQCVCPEGSYGNPLSEKGCSPNHPIRLVNLRTESSSRVTATASSSISCRVSSDCPTNLMCLGLICVDPCKNLCGVNAVCKVLNHIGTCECLPGYVGDPFLRCQVSSSHSGGCPPNTCGIKAICEMKVGKVFCKCPQGHYGNPLHRCTPECEIDDNCSNKQFCKDFRCQNACGHDTCVQGALCNAAGHRPVCTCPPGYLGSPQSRCYPECSEHSHCPGNKACLMSKCKDPCENSCGLNAKCETKNHVPICSCPKGMTGHPFDRCRPFTSEDICIPNPCGANANCKAVKNHEGNLQALCTCPPGYYGKPLVECKRGNCVDSHDCPSNMVCQRSQCMNPCNEEKCGIDALCRVNSHRVYCLCPDRYTGNAFERCYPPRN